jgi:hypothetical protein
MMAGQLIFWGRLADCCFGNTFLYTKTVLVQAETSAPLMWARFWTHSIHLPASQPIFLRFNLLGLLTLLFLKILPTNSGHFSWLPVLAAYPVHRRLQELTALIIRRCIQKFPDWVHNEINNNNNNKHLLRSNTKGYGGKTHKTDSQNSDRTVSSGRELYHLECSLLGGWGQSGNFWIHSLMTYTCSKVLIM